MEDLRAFCASLNNRSVGVIGVGISNRPVIDFLLRHGARVTARDRRDPAAAKELIGQLRARDVACRFGEDYLENITESLLLKSPGVRPDLPQLQKAVDNGAVLSSEMELFLRFCPCPVFAVTGSDGKTTTTTLTSLFLRAAAENTPRRVFLGGNIGTPLLPQIEAITKEDFVAAELSSFQLFGMRPHIARAALTNITPNHLNWHTDMQEYIDAKKNIFLGQSACDVLVLNAQNPQTAALVSTAPGQAILFSSEKEPQLCAPNIKAVYFLRKSSIIRRDRFGERAVLDTAHVLLPGRHNLENIMTAAALTEDFVPHEKMQRVIDTFSGVAHRLQLVRKKDGVLFYNSSIDSSPARTRAALSTFGKNVILILGGYDKKVSYEPLCRPVSQHAKAVVLTGASAPLIEKALAEGDGAVAAAVPRCTEPNFEAAVRRAAALAAAGDAVVLSPACASFDCFANFEERGNTFCKIVNSL